MANCVCFGRNFVSQQNSVQSTGGSLTAFLCRTKPTDAFFVVGRLVLTDIRMACECNTGDITACRRSSSVLPNPKPNVHKHGDNTNRQDAVLSSVFVVYISPRGCWNQSVDSSSSPGAALHAASKQRILHNRSK